jgi:hypothetical protein
MACSNPVGGLLLGWGVFHVAGNLIHLLLVIALVVFLINFITGRRTI